jgi:iron complex outermembrane recepter protein
LPDVAASAAEIQVQRGVGTSSNGAGAFGATVNVDLSRILPDPGATLSTTIGSFGTRKVSAQGQTGLLRDKWSFSGRVSAIQSEGYIDRGAADLSSMHISGAYVGDRHTLQVHVLSGKEVTYQAWNGTPAQYLDDPVLRRYNTAGTEKPGAPYANEVDDYTQRHILLHHKWQLAPQLLLQLNGHYTRGKGFYEQYKAAEAFENYGLTPVALGDTLVSNTDLIRRRWLDNHFYGTTFALRWSDKNLVALLGGAASRYEGQHFGEIIWSSMPIGQTKDFRYYDNAADKRDANVYFKLERTFDQNWHTFLDLQGRIVSYKFLGFTNELIRADQSVEHLFFNPKIGLSYTLSNVWNVYGYFGVAHREPNRDDYTQSSPDARPKPERLMNVEAGVKMTKERAGFAANLFYMRYQDQLVLDGRINDVGAYIRTNVPNSYRAGVELETTVQWNAWFSAEANLTVAAHRINTFNEYIDNWDTYGQETVVHRQTNLAFSPAMMGRVALTAQLIKSNRGRALSATLIGKYVGKQYLDNTSNEQAQLPGYLVNDLRLNATLGKQVRIILSINNLLDATYASNGWVYRYVSAGYDARPDDPYTRLESGNVYHQAGFFPQAERHWMATLAVDF